MIKINGETWRIFLVSPNHPILYSNGIYTLGACDNATHSIYINENLNSRKMKKVLLVSLLAIAGVSVSAQNLIKNEKFATKLKRNIY